MIPPLVSSLLKKQRGGFVETITFSRTSEKASFIPASYSFVLIVPPGA
jgi:hypothetical protein